MLDDSIVLGFYALWLVEWNLHIINAVNCYGSRFESGVTTTQVTTSRFFLNVVLINRREKAYDSRWMDKDIEEVMWRGRVFCVRLTQDLNKRKNLGLTFSIDTDEGREMNLFDRISDLSLLHLLARRVDPILLSFFTVSAIKLKELPDNKNSVKWLVAVLKKGR